MVEPNTTRRVETVGAAPAIGKPQSQLGAREAQPLRSEDQQLDPARVRIRGVARQQIAESRHIRVALSTWRRRRRPKKRGRLQAHQQQIPTSDHRGHDLDRPRVVDEAELGTLREGANLECAVRRLHQPPHEIPCVVEVDDASDGVRRHDQSAPAESQVDLAVVCHAAAARRGLSAAGAVRCT